MNPPRFFSAAEIERRLEFGSLANAIAQMFAAGPQAPVRSQFDLDGDTLLLMPAWSSPGTDDGGALGVKLVTVMPGNRERGHPTVNGIYLLFDRVTGVPSAAIDGDALTLMRTAAASMLAARYLARSDARNLLVIGTGRLAPYLARAHCTGRDIERIWIWGRRNEGAHSVAQMLRDHGLPAQAVDDLRQAVGEAHIISCATTATAPIVHGAWVEPGTHIDLVGGFRRGMREADDVLIARSRLFVDTRAGALAEAADLLEPIERGVITRADVLGELAELVTGTVAGRGGRDEVTVFKSVGTAIEDLAAARLLVQAS